MYKQMLKRRAFLRAQIDECIHVISVAPPGKLEVHKNNASTRWYVKPDKGPRKYLPKSEHETAARLAEKRIKLIRLSALEKELRATDLYLKYCPKNSDLLSFAEKNILVTNLIEQHDQSSWHLQPFNSNPSFPENLKHPSPSGHMLRSKSECIIDMELFYREIPFRYECELNFGGYVTYPDFTFYNPRTGEFKYWEHFGMMDDPSYRRKALEKIDLYLSYGLVPGTDVFFTYETSKSPLTLTQIDHVIDEIKNWLD